MGNRALQRTPWVLDIVWMRQRGNTISVIKISPLRFVWWQWNNFPELLLNSPFKEKWIKYHNCVIKWHINLFLTRNSFFENTFGSFLTGLHTSPQISCIYFFSPIFWFSVYMNYIQAHDKKQSKTTTQNFFSGIFYSILFLTCRWGFPPR